MQIGWKLSRFVLAVTLLAAMFAQFAPASVQALGTTEELRGVAYGGGLFVAVGKNGVMLASSDGATWIVVASGTTSHLWGVGHGGGQFVAVGSGGRIQTSPNGITWTARTSGTTNVLWSVAYGGGQFVVMGANGTILTSWDGITWTPRISSITDGLNVGYGGGQFVAVGTSGVILVSPDGVTWTAKPSGTENYLGGVAYGGGQFVAVGVGGLILLSPDGTHWAERTSGTFNELDSVAYGGGWFVVVGDNGTMLISPDGAHWSVKTSGTTNWLNDIVYDGSQFVTVGNDGTILWSSGLSSAPTLTASDGASTSGVQVSLTASSGAVYYLIYRSIGPDGPKLPANGYLTASLSGLDSWTTPGVTYYYWAKTCNASGCSSPGIPDAGWRALTAPVITASDGTSSDKVQISWTASFGATSYLLYRSESLDGTKTPATGYSTTSLTSNDTGAIPGVKYYYWVKACNGSNCSALSAYDIGWR